jgi:protein involved in polysaccharide export with SLBB domain
VGRAASDRQTFNLVAEIPRARYASEWSCVTSTECATSFALKGITSMFRRQRVGLFVATAICVALVCAVNLGIAGSQEQPKTEPALEEKTKQNDDAAVAHAAEDAEKRLVEIEKMIAEYDLTPKPLPSIPDDPPPHEGAMITLPSVVEPPDLILVELLEGLPGRPISGERLLRPDGMINLGFYGDVYVKGMTLEQVKVAIIKHLRRYVTDEAVGLETREGELPEMPSAIGVPKEHPQPLGPSDKLKDRIKPRPSAERSPSVPGSRRVRSASRQSTGNRVPVRPVRSQGVRVTINDQVTPASPPSPHQLLIGPQGKVTITIELSGQGAADVVKSQGAPIPQPVTEPVEGEEGPWRVVPPAKSRTLFVDITAYNSRNYYVLGDVMITGKLPWTGNETVLDALQFAGNLVATAEPKDIRLVRPGIGGKPPKIYKVDLAAIQERGEVTTNYQIFPNDRLIVGRNEVVKKTAEIDRLAAPIQSITANIMQEAGALRALPSAAAKEREELLKEYVDFWAKELSRPGGLKFDEQTWRDALIRKLKLTPAPR